MDLDAIVEEIAGQADDFLAGASSRKEARAGIAELLNADYPKISPDDRRKVTDQVMTILEEEDFFDSVGSGSAWEESAGADSDEAP